MPNNTLLRCQFNYKFGMLSVYASIKDIKFICTAYTRTAPEQNKFFKDGKSNCDGYKKISKHQLDRARDIVIIDDKGNPIWDCPEYLVLGQFWESMGGTWGLRWYEQGKTKFKDHFHFQY